MSSQKSCQVFQDWDDKVKLTERWQSAQFLPAGSPQYLNEFVNYIKERKYKVSHGLQEKEVESFCTSMKEKWVPIAEGIQTHWKHWKHQSSEFQKCLDQPQENICYSVADYAVPGLLFPLVFFCDFGCPWKLWQYYLRNPETLLEPPT